MYHSGCYYLKLSIPIVPMRQLFLTERFSLRIENTNLVTDITIEVVASCCLTH